MEATINLKFTKNVCYRLSFNATLPSKIFAFIHVKDIANK